MNEENLGERVARIEGAQEFMVAELRRARTFGRIAWVALFLVIGAVCVVGFRLGELFVQQCGWM